MTECCATCDRFALEPGRRKAGACLMHCPAISEPIYVRVLSFDVCDWWVPVGRLEHLTPYIIGEQP